MPEPNTVFEVNVLEGFANELRALLKLGRKLDELDLGNEEPASIFVNRGGK